MSKTIETLKRAPLKEDALYTHIADTYFHQKHRPKTKKRKQFPLIDNIARFSITAVLMIICLAALISAVSFSHSRYTTYLKNKFVSSKNINLLHNGAVNREIIKNFEFRGYAKNGESRISKGLVILNNPQKYNWADLSIDFKFPVDVSRRTLELALRGNVGGERVNIALRDVNNRAARLNDMSLSSNWTEKLIHLKYMKGEIDLSRVNHLRIECGYVGESAKEKNSPINVKLYIKKIGLTKEM